jgi:very-short-patch-repair endonuclease
VSPDALFVDAGLIHETNGRAFHAADDVFEEMQERNDALVAAGLTVLHNSPRRILADPSNVRAEVERCYQRLRGNGLPPGVVVVRAPGRGKAALPPRNGG